MALDKNYKQLVYYFSMKKQKKVKSMAGSLRKYWKDYSTEKMIKELQEERRKSDRF